MQHQHQFQMEVENGSLLSSSQDKEEANGSPAQEGVPEEASEGQNKELSIQVSATKGNRTGMLNDNNNSEEGINPANPNTDEKAVVLAQTEPNPSQENWILQKRVRPPRYFEPQTQECDSSSLHVRWCGIRVYCKNKKSRKTKVCFICGRFGHKGKQCKQVRGCFICRTKGHLAIDCPDKNTGVDLAHKLCLKCGSSGHDMFSCANDYDPDDLKTVQCYICKKFGHLCCAENRGEKPAASCYYCGQFGHVGSECTQGMAANIHREKEAAGDKCGKRKKSRRNSKRKKIKPTPIDYPSHGRINLLPTSPVVGPYYGKPGSSIFLLPEAAAAVATHRQHINPLAGTQVGNRYYPTAQPPHPIWNSQSGGQNPQLPLQQYRQVVINVHGDEAEIPGLFYRVPQPPHIPQHIRSDPAVTQNYSNLSNQLSHLNQNNPRPPSIHQNATPTPVIRTPIPQPLNQQIGFRLSHQNFQRQSMALLSHQNTNNQIGSNVPRTQVPHPLNHQSGIHLPHEIVHGQPPALLGQPGSDVARIQIPELLNRQSGFLPHQIAHCQPVALLPHKNSDNHTRSDVTRTQIPHPLKPQTGFLPHQIIHRQPATLLPHQNIDNQTENNVARTQIPHPLNHQIGFLPHQIHHHQPVASHPHQIYHHQPVASHPHQNSNSETGNSGSI